MHGASGAFARGAVVVSLLACQPLPAQWIGKGPNRGPIASISVSPAGFALAGGLGGLFRSTDGGMTWSWRRTNLPDHRVSIVRVSPANPLSVLVTTPSGIFSSADGGLSWKAPTASPAGSVTLLEADAAGRWYAATDAFGVFRSDDDGRSWKPARSGLPAGSVGLFPEVWGLAVAPQDGTVFVAFGRFGFAGTPAVFRSTDHGETWQPAGAALTQPAGPVAVDSTDSRTVYAADSGGRLFRSTNSGTSWAPVLEGPAALIRGGSAAREVFTVVVSAANVSLLRSIDAGASWQSTRIGNNVPSDLTSTHQGALVADGIEGVAMYDVATGALKSSALAASLHSGITVTTAGSVITSAVGDGLFRSTDGGTNWTRYEGTLAPAFQLASPVVLAGRHIGTPVFAGASAPLGLSLSDDDGSSWRPANIGMAHGDQTAPVISVAFSPSAPCTAYAGGEAAGVFLSKDCGNSWSATAAPFSGLSLPSVSALAVDPLDSRTVYAGLSTFPFGIVKSVDGGETWSEANAGLDGGGRPRIQAILADARSSGTLFAGTSNGVFKTVDGGISWERLALGLPETWISSLAGRTEAAVDLFAATGAPAGQRSRLGRIYRLSLETGYWIDVSGDLPNVPVLSLAIDGRTEPQLWVGTEGAGLYTSTIQALSRHHQQAWPSPGVTVVHPRTKP